MIDDELKRLFDSMREENAAAHAEARRDFRETADRFAAENGRRFDVFVERLEKRFDLLAESVETTNEKVDRGIGSLQETIGRTSAETHLSQIRW